VSVLTHISGTTKLRHFTVLVTYGCWPWLGAPGSVAVPTSGLVDIVMFALGGQALGSCAALFE